MKTTGIEEINDVVEALRVTSKTAGKVMSDSKVNLSDLQYSKDIIANFKVYTEALEGIKEVTAEAKDLDDSELISIATSFLGVIRAYKEGKKEA